MRRLIERYRLPESFVKYSCNFDPTQPQGFFTFGEGTVCFGSCSAGKLASSVDDGLCDVRDRVRFHGDTLQLPLDPDQLLDNLLLERYQTKELNPLARAILPTVYYGLRPLLPVTVRKHLQRYYLAGWEKIRFPRWPVDVTVERILEQCLGLLMKAQGLETLPFIWFWPDGYDSCAIVTHDVETEDGMNFCSSLMDLDDSCGIKSAFQIVPEGCYTVSPSFLSELRGRGFEINVQDLNHDGRLLRDEKQFMQRIVAINRYGREFGAAGFRAAVLYRNLRWWHALEFEYDMSVPNAAHLEPQRGGCCTVLPYFIGQLLELPSTTTQDYAVFHFLREYSLEPWKRQIELIREKHGLISILVHPDYILKKREQEIYLQLLRYLDRLRSTENVWITTPAHLNTWWRARSKLSLIRDGSEWRIKGAGSERARLAYARLDGDTIRYQIAALPAIRKQAAGYAQSGKRMAQSADGSRQLTAINAQSGKGMARGGRGRGRGAGSQE
jgi:hypothetical protein